MKSSVTIQMKAIEQYSPEGLYIMMVKVVLNFECVDEILKCVIEIKTIEQYFPMVLFIMIVKAVLIY